MLRIGPAPPARPVQADCVWKQRCSREERGARRPPPFALSEPPAAASPTQHQLGDEVRGGDEARPTPDAGQGSGSGRGSARVLSSSRSGGGDNNNSSSRSSVVGGSSRSSSNDNVGASRAYGEDDGASVTGSVRSARSRDSRRSQWSLTSFRTEDSGFSYYASKKLADLEARIEEERHKREAAEAKLDRLMSILQHRELLRK